MDFKTMLELPALDTDQVVKILQEIADKERKQEKPQMPQVSISTHSGSASGFFVNHCTEKKVILLADMYDHKAHFQYIASHSISTISVSNIDKYAYLFSDGRIPFSPDKSEIPSLLQLKKHIKTLELALNDSLGKEVSIAYSYKETPTDLEKFYASKVLGLLKETLSNIAKDKMANEAFSESISSLNFKLGSENNVLLQENMLSITIDISKALKSFPDTAQLQNQIEKNL